MPSRPYVILSCATSADGYLDDASPRRLILSGPADLDRVDEVRAGCDAILVGAGTVRADDPRLLIRDPRRRARRAARGLPEHPARVTLTATGDLDPGARFFAPGADRLVYCATPALRPRPGPAAGTAPCSSTPVIPCPSMSSFQIWPNGAWLVSWSKAARASWLSSWPATWPTSSTWPSPRSSSPTPPPPASTSPRTPDGPENPMTLAEVRRLEGVVLHRYLLGPGGPDQRFLGWAVELSRLCPPSESAFSVGAVVVGEDGEVLSTGFSREQEEHDHAEEVALRKLGLP